MKNKFNLFGRLLSKILIITLISACSSTGKPGSLVSSGKPGSSASSGASGSSDSSAASRVGAVSSPSAGITARGAIGERLETGTLYTGDGGRNIRLAVIAPSTQGEVPGYLPIYIQGLLNNNIGRFSAINLIDRQNLETIISEQDIILSGVFSDDDFVRIGSLTNSQYFLFGTIQRLSGNRYALQLSITESNTGIRLAGFMKEGSLSQIEGSGTLINEATEELLTQMGVQLTDAGRQTLLAGNTSVVRAETGLARGITAQTGGDEIEALFSFTQAVSFDPSRMESISRLSTISSDISRGTISERIVNDIQARNRWIEVFRETAKFYNEHPPFEIIFDPNLLQIGVTDYIRSTANLGMRIALQPSQAGFNALNTLLDGLEKTARRDVWRFSGWPFADTNPGPNTRGTVVFGGRKSFSYRVDIELINENNERLGRSSAAMTANLKDFSIGDKRIELPNRVVQIVNFPNIKAEDLTQTLTIAIIAVNGKPSHELNTTGYMKIDTGNLESLYSQTNAAQTSVQTQSVTQTIRAIKNQ